MTKLSRFPSLGSILVRYLTSKIPKQIVSPNLSLKLLPQAKRLDDHLTPALIFQDKAGDQQSHQEVLVIGQTLSGFDVDIVISLPSWLAIIQDVLAKSPVIEIRIFLVIPVSLRRYKVNDNRSAVILGSVSPSRVEANPVRTHSNPSWRMDVS